MPTLDWLDRDAAFRVAARVATRVLRPHAAGHRFGDAGTAPGNLLVQGDNLEALQALLPFYRGQVKCIFIDPPYNTRSAFEHYDDNLEHSQWLSMMLPRLQLLREFLREDGSIWVTIDDHEGHYLKVLMDEVFGRGNFIATIAWEKDRGGRGDADISTSQDMVLAFARRRQVWASSRNLLERTTTQAGRFRNPDNDPRGPWRQGDDGTAKSGTERQRFPITLPSGRTVTPKQGRYWAFSEDTFNQARVEGRVYFGKDGNRLPLIKRYADAVREGVAPRTWWPAEEAGTNQSAKRDHLRKLMPEVEPFATPKPEELLRRVLQINTNPGDLVLDSFLGSGTTAAVAHKMGRRWIGIEAGDHAVSHCLPRLQKVVEGESGGISQAVGWTGGGGFRFLQLGAPLFDAQGDLNAEVRFADLAAFVWMRESGTAYEPAADASSGTPLLGVHGGRAIYLLYNGILGDRRPASGNVLTSAVLDALRRLCWHVGPKVVYGEACLLGDARLADAGIVFRQLPYALPR